MNEPTPKDFPKFLSRDAEGHQKMPEPSISETIRNLRSSTENDVAAILAGAINLYTETLVRLRGNSEFFPDDARQVLEITEVLLDTANQVSDFRPKVK